MTYVFAVTVFPRLCLAAAYLGGSIYVVDKLIDHLRTDPTATHDLKTNQPITMDDIETEATARLVGRRLNRAVMKGDRIAPDMVAPLPPQSPMFAVLVPLPASAVQQRHIAENSGVVLKLLKPQLSLPGKVARLQCDDRNCGVVVILDKTPPQALDAAALNAAEVELQLPVPPAPTP
jgi:hypothetical protein